jgi:outer membrane protein TolC
MRGLLKSRIRPANPLPPFLRLRSYVRPISALVLACGCASVAEGRIDGKVSSSPATQIREEVRPSSVPPIDPKLVEQFAKGGSVSLAQLIGFALRTNPSTRATWADARAAAAAAGSKMAAYFPQLDVSGGWAYAHNVFSPTTKFAYKDWNAGVQLSWLLLDFGGRGADADEARALLAAANLNHDAAVQDLVLLVEQAYAQYQGARALLAAQKVSVDEANTNLQAAEERRREGLSTIADVLQARTALSQAQLNLQTVAGQVETLRGAVATAVGVPANVPVEAEDLPNANVDQQLARIDDLIAQAQRERPDLQRARAQVDAAKSHATSVQSRGLPQIFLTGNMNELAFIQPGYPTGNNYSAALSLRWPLFTGFRDSYDAAQADEQAKAAAARAESVEQQAILSVWSSYQSVKTAVQRVRTARDLLASAQQSAEVTQGRYKEGVGSILDVLTAQAALASARAQEVQARADWQLAVASLAHDTGSLGPAPAAGEQK